MIRLIASDIDGTLLKEGSDQLNPEFYDVIRELRKKEILFVASSGRQYESMRYVFAPIVNDILFIAENGSVIMQEDKPLHSWYIKPEVAEKLIKKLREYPDGELILSRPEQFYLETDEKVRKILDAGYHAKYQIVSDLLPYCRHTNKITIHREYALRELGESIREEFGDELNVMISGTVWIDMMNKGIDKGSALALIQEKLGIRKEETIAFGDNCNDIGMLQQAGISYAVEDANPDLKNMADHIVPSYKKDGVLNALKQLLKEMGEEQS